MLKVKLSYLLVVLGLISTFARAEEISQKVTQPAPGKSFLELAAVGGFPVGAGISLGYWGSNSVPIVVRTSAGFGVGLDLGVKVWHDENKAAFVAASAGVFGATRRLMPSA